jgi:DNA-binding LytR/AlgR family response regulator
MEAKKILIVEDEILESESMILTLSDIGYECQAVCTGEEAIEVVKANVPDIILMDIGLAGKLDGMSTANIIRRHHSMPIIFITDQANEQVFQQAKGVLPHNFISKPYSDTTLLHAVELALVQTLPLLANNAITPFGERVADGIFVYYGNEYKKVFFTDILYLKASGMSTIMCCSQGKCYKIALSSNNVVEQLAYAGIVKTSRSHYVNIHRVDSIKNDELIVENKPVPLSKNYKADVLKRFNKISQK